MISINTGTRKWLRALAAMPLLVAGMVAVVQPAPAAAAPGGATAVPPLRCTGNGTDGHRVEWVYTYETGTPNRLADRLPYIRAAAWAAQQNINDSARREGAQRWLRFVTGATGCELVVRTVEVPAGSTNVYFKTWRATLQSLGLTASNRIYSVFTENYIPGYCGLSDPGDVPDDTNPSTGSSQNRHPVWVTFAKGCFSGNLVTHELTHALGAMGEAMPHSNVIGNDAGHCTDGYEVLCGSSGLTTPCPDPLASRLLDCGRDDYFAINPQGSYLPSHFNIAWHSLYLDHGTATTPQTTVAPLPPQLLRAADVEGTSIAFSWVPSFELNGPNQTLQYEVLRNGVVIGTQPASRPHFRATGLAMNTSASYAVRTRVTYDGVTRTSVNSPSLTVTTNSSTAQAGAAENGALVMLANALVDGNGRSLVMDVAGYRMDDNAGIQQWDQTNAVNQRWRLNSATGGTYTITSDNSPRCLTPLGGQTTAGTPIVQTTCNGTAAQRWTFTVLSGVTYHIKTSAGTCIGAKDNATGNASLVLAACSTTQPSQRWTTVRIG
ncbi:MAG TPA: RICIN domain-containing protein [Micromonosporaceae bacterium]|nr:RICIN domain-containing protein [Micromonosporaceae bacterium]